MNEAYAWWTCSPKWTRSSEQRGPEPEKPQHLSNASWRNPNWAYIGSSHTDIRVTFERVRRELANQAKRKS